MRYFNFNGDFNGLPKYVLTGVIPEYSLQTSDILMMTAASDNHAFLSFNCLYSMVLADPYASYVYIDLGIRNETLSILFSHFKTIHQIQQKMKSTGVIGYRVFNWDSFPDWISIYKTPQRHQGYSWKVISLVDIFNEWKAIVYWLDGGCVIRDGISREITMVRHYGLYSAYSDGTVKQWTHNDTQHFMVNNKLLHHYVDGTKPMAMATCFIVDYSNATIRNQLMPNLLKCAYTQKCIVPRSCIRDNHRHDQSILTLLIYDLNIPYSASVKRQYSPAHHNDGVKEDRNTVLRNLLLKIKNTYSIYFYNDYYNISNWKQTREKYGYVSRPIDVEWNG